MKPDLTDIALATEAPLTADPGPDQHVVRLGQVGESAHVTWPAGPDWPTGLIGQLSDHPVHSAHALSSSYAADSDRRYLTVSGVSELAEAVESEHRKRNTERAFRADWVSWMRFCDWAHTVGLDVFPAVASDESLLLFARWLATESADRAPAAPETIRRRLTGVLAGWSANRVDYPRGVSGRARRWVGGYEAALIETKRATGRGQAPPMRVAALARLVAATGHGNAGARDAALLVLGFAIGARRAELAHLDTDDVTDTEDGLRVLVRVSKSGHRSVAVIPGQNAATCPVRNWWRWRELAGDGPAFRRVDRHGNVGGRLSPAGVGAVVTRCARRAGLEHHMTGHSLRSGFATEARRAGRTPEQIADQGGWARGSTALQGYIRSVDEWTDNVLAGIGL